MRSGTAAVVWLIFVTAFEVKTFLALPRAFPSSRLSFGAPFPQLLQQGLQVFREGRR